MYEPVEVELYEIWDVAAEPFKPKITIEPYRTVCDWMNEETFGGRMIVIFKESYAEFPDLWLQPVLQDDGFFSRLIRKGYPYWKNRIDYWVIPQWNDASKPVFEHVGFRESELFPGKYGGNALVIDLNDEDSPAAEWVESDG